MEAGNKHEEVSATPNALKESCKTEHATSCDTPHYMFDVQHRDVESSIISNQLENPTEEIMASPIQSICIDGTAFEETSKAKRKKNQSKDPSYIRRKKLRELLKKGVPFEEANLFSKVPGQYHPPGLLKRYSSNKQSGEIKEQETSSSITNTGYIENIKIGILSVHFPNELLPPDRLRSIQSDILDKIVRQVTHNIKPKFNGIDFKSGFLEITCADKITATWIKEIVPDLKPWHSASLKAMDAAEIPYPEILIGDFPISVEDTTEKIFTYIGAQNEGMNISAWVEFSRSIEEKMVHLTFTVDPKSFQNLIKWEYKINYKFGQVQLKTKYDIQKVLDVNN